MRWNSPKDKEIRKVKKFAFLPTKMNDHTTVFLERYIATQQYVMYSECDSGYWWTTAKEATVRVPRAVVKRSLLTEGNDERYQREHSFDRSSSNLRRYLRHNKRSS